MKLGLFPFLAAVTAACTFGACGGSTSDNSPAPDAGVTTDAGIDPGSPDAADEAPPPLDHGKPSTTYPAFKPDMPAIGRNGGRILTAPVIVPVTWETDPNVARIDSFVDQIGTTDYWATVVKEYGVGVATVGGHVHIPVTAASPLPTTLSTDELEQIVDDGAGAGAAGWPAPTAQTIYLVFPHPSTAVTATTQSGPTPACSVFGGYHTVTQGNLIYALALPCSKNKVLANLTATASHELGEAATDPEPSSGYMGLDSNHISWSMFLRGTTENGDACQYYSDAEYLEAAPFDFQVQRLWSNAAAAAGKNPCVPAAPGPYFGVTPTALEMVSYSGRQGAIMTKGINIPVGATKTFPVGFFSEAAMSGPFSARVSEGFTPGVVGPSASHLSVSIDKTSGLNGEIAYVTVTVNKAGVTLDTRSYAKANYVTVLASLGGVTHYMPILITNN